MNTSHLIKTFLAAAAFGAANLATSIGAEEKEEKVPFAKLPAAVQRTIQSQQGANSATLGEIEKDEEDGKVTYEAILTLPNGKKLEVEVAVDGTLIKVESEDDDEKGGDAKEEDEDKDDKK